MGSPVYRRTVKETVPGIDVARFAATAQQAKLSCTVLKVLAAIPAGGGTSQLWQKHDA